MCPVKMPFLENAGVVWGFLLNRTFLGLDVAHVFSVRIIPSTVFSILDNSSLIFLS